jgi:hypothetical protein
MKRYMLFQGISYEANGGWHDFVKSGDTAEELVPTSFVWSRPYQKSHERCEYKQRGERQPSYRSKQYTGFDWWHVVDGESGDIVLSDASYVREEKLLTKKQVRDAEAEYEAFKQVPSVPHAM